MPKEKEELPFEEWVEMLFLKPYMFTLGGTFEETVAYLLGYSTAKETPISGRDFNQFVCLKNGFPSNYHWSYVIKACHNNNEVALEELKNTTNQFLTAKAKHQVEKLMEEALQQAAQEEGEAEQVFRQLDAALLRGDKTTIQALILEHPDAPYLWAEAYPEEITKQLEDISSTQPIKKINSQANSCSIITSGWPFPIDMYYLEGQWKVDPRVIIEMRKRTAP